MVYIHNGITLSYKKELSLVICNIIDLECIMLSEINQRKTNTIWFHSYVESKNTNITRQKQTNRYREQKVSCQKRGGWGRRVNRWGRLRDINFQLQSNRVMTMKFSVCGL